jgi:hypothetical protein
MKRKRAWRALFCLWSVLQITVVFPRLIASGPQEDPSKKRTYDYMNTILSRNTKSLGLKENRALDRLLKQPGIYWAIRAAARHILD